MQKINEKDRDWEPDSHEDPANPGVYKKVLIRHDEVNPPMSPIRILRWMRFSILPKEMEKLTSMVKKKRLDLEIELLFRPETRTKLEILASKSYNL